MSVVHAIRRERPRGPRSSRAVMLLAGATISACAPRSAPAPDVPLAG